MPTALKQDKKYEQLMHTIFVDLIELWSAVDKYKLQQLRESNKFEEYYSG